MWKIKAPNIVKTILKTKNTVGRLLLLDSDSLSYANQANMILS